MSIEVSDRELSSILGSLFTRLNRNTHSKLGEQILLLEYKLRCSARFTGHKNPTPNREELDVMISVMEKTYVSILKRYRKTCFLGKLRILWYQFGR